LSAISPNETPKYIAQDDWVIKLQFCFTGAEQEQVTVLGHMTNPTAGGAWFYIPGQSKLVTGTYDTVLEPLVFTIIPSQACSQLLYARRIPCVSCCNRSLCNFRAQAGSSLAPSRRSLSSVVSS
jgi:hypothetical protein